MKISLIDCENLSSPPQHRMAVFWRAMDRIELFGRASLVEPWRQALAEAGLAAAAETLVAEDAPDQAADQAMAQRVDALLAGAVRPRAILIASNDKGFDADIARARAAGVTAERRGDPTPPELLRLVVELLAGEDGWAQAGGVGDHLQRRFGLAAAGRLETWARLAGLPMRRDRNGMWLKTTLS